MVSAGTGPDKGDPRPGPAGDGTPAGRRRPRHRPPWWPEGESWPPVGPDGRPTWAGRRDGHVGRRGPASFAWRFGCLVSSFLLVLVSVAVLLLWLIGSLLGALGTGQPGGGLGDLSRAAGLVVLVAGIVGLVAVGRLLGRSGRTLDDLVEAAGRVEGGDYTVRVPEPERGPRDLRDLARRFNTMVWRLETDERQRRSLLADVSHELRTPLAVVRGNVEAIVDGVYPADEAHLRAILDETGVMARLIEDLRTLALSEAGTLALHREPTDLAVLAADVAGVFATVADEAGVSIVVEADDRLPPLDVDPIRTREVLENLVANALRHTPGGGTIRIAASPEPDDRVRVAVTDTGSGVDPSILPILFDRFTRSAGSNGSGLGLAIARQLVVAHGGEIGAVSEPGLGTTIWFRLPLARPES